MFALCYIDEAGCTGILPFPTSPIQPVFVISALFIEQKHIIPITKEFLALKWKYFPGKFSGIVHDLDAMTVEIKGSDLRRDIRKGNRNERNHAYSFIDEVFDLLDKYQVKLIGRIWVKGLASAFNGQSIYTTTTQRIAAAFQDYLTSARLTGAMIGDFRQPTSNSFVSHSVFTQKYRLKAGGDPYPSILEVPTFGISNNHACLQITDILTSAVLYPIATYCYCTGIVTNVHVHPADMYIRQRYKKRLKKLQYSYLSNGVQQRGITVSDPHQHLTSWQIFRP